MIEAVIFDMDGLMFDTEKVWRSCWAPSLGEFGLEPTPELYAKTMGCNREKTEAVLGELYGSAELGVSIAKTFYDMAFERLMAGVEAKPGLYELFDFLVQGGVPIAVASGSPRFLVQNSLEQHDLYKYCRAVMTGDAIKASKPAPDIFLAASKELGIAPEKTLVIEDSFNGVRAGAAGGYVTVMVPDMMEPTDEIRSLATRVCADLLEVRDLLAAAEL